MQLNTLALGTRALTWTELSREELEEKISQFREKRLRRNFAEGSPRHLGTF